MDAILTAYTDNRGFEGIAAMLFEGADSFRVPDIYLKILNTLLTKGPPEFFALRMFFL